MAVIDRQKQPFRLYRPGWLTYDSLYSLKNDLDRELDLISRSLLVVTQRLDEVETALNLVLNKYKTDATIKPYLDQFLYDSAGNTLWPDNSLKGARNG